MKAIIRKMINVLAIIAGIKLLVWDITVKEK